MHDEIGCPILTNQLKAALRKWREGRCKGGSSNQHTRSEKIASSEKNEEGEDAEETDCRSRKVKEGEYCQKKEVTRKYYSKFDLPQLLYSAKDILNTLCKQSSYRHLLESDVRRAMYSIVKEAKESFNKLREAIIQLENRTLKELKKINEQYLIELKLRKDREDFHLHQYKVAIMQLESQYKFEGESESINEEIEIQFELISNFKISSKNEELESYKLRVTSIIDEYTSITSNFSSISNPDKFTKKYHSASPTHNLGDLSIPPPLSPIIPNNRQLYDTSTSISALNQTKPFKKPYLLMLTL